MRAEDFYRGTLVMSISVDTGLFPNEEKVFQYGAYTVSATSGGLAVVLQDSRRFKTGGVQCEIWNAGSNSFNVRGFTGTVLATLAPGDWATVSLFNNAAAAGQWRIHVGAAGAATEAAPTLLSFYVGGTTSGNSNKTHQYSHVSDAWTTKTDSTNQQVQSSCTTLAGAAFFLGTGTGADHRLVSKYDPDTWTAATAIPNGTSAQSSENDCASTMSGKAMSFGGTSQSLRTMEYDGASTWTVKSSRPATRGWTFVEQPYPGADISNGTTYLLAGGNATDTGHNFCDSYVADTYAALTERGLPVYNGEGHCKNDSAGEIFALCGIVGFSGGNTIYANRVTKYNVAANAHSVVISFPQACASLIGVSIGTKARFCFGTDLSGSSGGSILAMREFDMVAQTYATKTSAPTAKDLQVQNQGAAIPP